MEETMDELWDIYDENRKKTGKLAERDLHKFKKGEYHIVVTGIKNLRLLKKQRRMRKKHMKRCSAISMI